MRTFFLYILFANLLQNPLLALLLVGAVLYFSEARFSGRYFNPAKIFTTKQTIAELQKEIAVNEHNVAAQNDLGRILVENGKPAEGREHLRLALARMDDTAETQFFYGMACLKTGHEEEGRKHIEQAVEIDSRFLYGRPQTELARHELENSRFQQAIDWAERAVKINTSSVEAWLLLGQARQQSGATEKARDAYERAIAAHADLPRYLKLPNRKWLKEAKRAAKSL